MADLEFWKNKRVLVTGGGGFLGSYVVENLMAIRGVPAEHIVVPRSKNFDLREPDVCLQITRGCNIVILLADLYHREYDLPMAVVYSANAYGPRDSLDQVHAHVIPSLIMKCFREKELRVWGDGTGTRDFLFASDIAEGIVLAVEKLEAPD